MRGSTTQVNWWRSRMSSQIWRRGKHLTDHERPQDMSWFMGGVGATAGECRGGLYTSWKNRFVIGGEYLARHRRTMHSAQNLRDECSADGIACASSFHFWQRDSCVRVGLPKCIGREHHAANLVWHAGHFDALGQLEQDFFGPSEPWPQ